MKWALLPFQMGLGRRRWGPGPRLGAGMAWLCLPSRWFQAWEQGRDRVSQINPHLSPGYQLKFLPSLGASEQQTNPGEGLLLQGPRKH